MQLPIFSFSPVVYSYQRGHVIGPHSHPFPQLLYASSGVISAETPHGTWIVPPQRAVWLPTECRHRVRMLTDVEVTSMYLSRVTELDDLECGILEVCPLMRELLLSALKMDADANLTNRENIILQLLQEELRRAKRGVSPIPMPQDPRLMELCSKILLDPSLDYSLSHLALEVGASPRTIARLFDSELGMSYRRWREQVQVAYAIAQLAEGRPAKVVASDLGYTASAFSVMMRRTALKSPPLQH